MFKERLKKLKLRVELEILIPGIKVKLNIGMYYFSIKY